MPRLASALIAFMIAIPAPAFAQIDTQPPIIPPCPWWHCENPPDVVVELYQVDTTIEDGIATTRVTQVLRNKGDGLAEGEFLMPIPADAAVTGLTLWIDGEPVDGELLDGDVARQTYEDIVRRTLDPALLEFVDDDLLRLSVFPIPAGVERRVEVRYRQVLSADGGLVRYRQPMAREHRGVEVEHIVARIEVRDEDGVKAIHSPTHAISLNRLSESSAIAGFEGSGPATGDFALYYSTDDGPVSMDVISYREGDEGWFVLLASPGLAPDDAITPKDLVLVLDVSGSMEGEKIDQARRAARYVLEDLNPEDRFEVLAFSTGVDAFGDGLRPASEAGEASAWVTGLAAGGSTDIHRALTRAFDLAEPGRPLYVMFMTDGLPTEGIVDTPEILDALEPSETTSVFAFGVGFDVDTILLDSITRDHHGTTQYVVPGEEIDTAMRSLSQKVASPVLTAVQLEIEGVAAFDVYPDPLPDLFSGGQLVVAGRYEGSGPATATLRGRLKGEPVEITYEDVPFAESGGDDDVPALWATRKIGALLRQIRFDGPDEETIEQIVRISVRHGIVTPYTSYLVTEDAPFGDDALEDISREAAERATTLAPTGEAAVGAADASAQLSASDVGAGTDESAAGIVVTTGGRTLRLTGGIWIDTTYDPDMETRRVAYGSDDYFSLARSNSDVADVLAAGPNVIVVIGDVAIEVTTDGGPSDTLPESATTTTTTVPPGSSGDGGGFAIEPIDPMESDSSAAVVAILSALAAVGALAVVASRKR